jgi:hypothetical protein
LIVYGNDIGGKGVEDGLIEGMSEREGKGG